MTVKYPEGLSFLLLSGGDGPQSAQWRGIEGGGREGGREREEREEKECGCERISSGVKMTALFNVFSIPLCLPASLPPSLPPSLRNLPRSAVHGAGGQLQGGRRINLHRLGIIATALHVCVCVCVCVCMCVYVYVCERESSVSREPKQSRK